MQILCIYRDDVASLGLKFPFGKIPSAFSRRIRQHYYAATSYVDSLIGRLLKAASKFGDAKNTIVLLMSDHGWSLGTVLQKLKNCISD